MAEMRPHRHRDDAKPRVGEDPRLQLTQAPASARAWLFLLAVALPMTIATIALALSIGDPGSTRLIADSVAVTWVATLGGLAALTLGIWFLVVRLLKRHRLRIDAHGLEVKTGFNTRTAAYTELHLDDARVVDLDERTEFKPMLRLGGTGLPGFHSGWYLLRNRSRAFVAITGGPRVLWIPTRKHHALLLQPRDPQRLLDALRLMAGDGSHPH